MYRITAVSYLNTYPLIYGLKNFLPDEKGLHFETAVPSEVARRLKNQETQIGLIPVAAFPVIPQGNIISNYCIGAEGAVRTVMLYSKKPLNEIKSIALDSDSRTSVMLARVLAKYHWKIKPEWQNMKTKSWPQSEAMVLIGDKTFGAFPEHPFAYDLAESWKEFTGLPFVFAVWAANCAIPGDFKDQFDLAQAEGLKRIAESILRLPENVSMAQAVDYLQCSISFDLDDAKKEAMALFLNYCDSLS